MFNYDTEKELKKIILKQSYYHFFKWSFNILFPNEKYEDAFHVKYLCDQLQEEIFRIVRKEEKGHDLVINIPPRSSKSLIVSVCWFAWAILHEKSLSMIAVSFDDSLSLLNAQYCKDLIKSDEYQELFGDEIKIRKDQDSKELFMTTSGAMRKSLSTGSNITGHKGMLIVCLPENQLITTEKGKFTIREIVENKLSLRILSHNFYTDKDEWKEIVSYQKNPSRRLVKITTESGKELVCTEDHRVWTENRGYVIAKELKEEDILKTL